VAGGLGRARRLDRHAGLSSATMLTPKEPAVTDSEGAVRPGAGGEDQGGDDETGEPVHGFKLLFPLSPVLRGEGRGGGFLNLKSQI
jgi:hypothetical protein